MHNFRKPVVFHLMFDHVSGYLEYLRQIAHIFFADLITRQLPLQYAGRSKQLRGKRTTLSLADCYG